MSDDLRKLEFTLEDQLDGKKLSPGNVDLPTLLDFLGDVEHLVRGNRASASLSDSRVVLEEGSLKIVPLVAVALAASFEFEMAKLNRTGNLDDIEKGRADVISKWQAKTQKCPQRVYGIGTEEAAYRINVIAGGQQYRYKSESAWVPVEKYLTGNLEEAGGKQIPNLHLSLPGARETLVVAASKAQLGAWKHQLYKAVTVFVRAEQHLLTKDLRKIQLIEIVQPNALVDENALQKLWQSGNEAWRDVVSASDWVEELRGH